MLDSSENQPSGERHDVPSSLGPPTAWDGAVAAARAVWLVTAIPGVVLLVVSCISSIARGAPSAVPLVVFTIVVYWLALLAVMLLVAVPLGALFALLNIVDWAVLAAPFVGCFVAYLTLLTPYAWLLIIPASIPVSIISAVLYASNVRFLRPQ